MRPYLDGLQASPSSVQSARSGVSQPRSRVSHEQRSNVRKRKAITTAPGRTEVRVDVPGLIPPAGKGHNSSRWSQRLGKVKSPGRSAKCSRSSTATTQHGGPYLTHATLEPSLVLNFGNRYGRMIRPLLFAPVLRSSHVLGEVIHEDGEAERRSGGSASIPIMYHQNPMVKPSTHRPSSCVRVRSMVPSTRRLLLVSPVMHISPPPSQATYASLLLLPDREDEIVHIELPEGHHHFQPRLLFQPRE